MTRLWSNNIAVLLGLNIGLALIMELLAGPYRFRPAAPDFEALRTYRNLLFPFIAVQIWAHIHLGVQRRSWRWVYYGLAFANYTAFTGFGALGPLATTFWIVVFE